MFKTKTIMVNEHDEILWYMRSILRMRNTRYYVLRKTCIFYLFIINRLYTFPPIQFHEFINYVGFETSPNFVLL